MLGTREKLDEYIASMAKPIDVYSFFLDKHRHLEHRNAIKNIIHLHYFPNLDPKVGPTYQQGVEPLVKVVHIIHSERVTQ